MLLKNFKSQALIPQIKFLFDKTQAQIVKKYRQNTSANYANI